MPASEKYAASEDGDKRTVGQNCADCGCETCTPDKWNVIYTIIIIVLGIAAVLAGTFISRDTIQSLEDYNFPVFDSFQSQISVANFLAYHDVAAIYIPGGNISTYPGTGTQTFLDFETNVTCTIDLDNQLCFLQPLNKAILTSYEKVKGSLVNNSKIVSLSEVVTDNMMKSIEAPYTQVMSLGHYSKGECIKMKKIFSLTLGAVTPIGTRTNCTSTTIPKFGIARVTGEDIFQIQAYYGIETSCIITP